MAWLPFQKYRNFKNLEESLKFCLNATFALNSKKVLFIFALVFYVSLHLTDFLVDFKDWKMIFG